MPFEIVVTARFHEVDRAGILFFNRVFEYAHICFEEMLAAAFGHPTGGYDPGGVGFPLVHAEASFHGMIRHGDRLTVRLTMERLTNRSMTCRYQVVGDGGDVRATVSLKHAFVDLVQMRPCDRTLKIDSALKSIGLIDDAGEPIP